MEVRRRRAASEFSGGDSACLAACSFADSQGSPVVESRIPPGPLIQRGRAPTRRLVCQRPKPGRIMIASGRGEQRHGDQRRRDELGQQQQPEPMSQCRPPGHRRQTACCGEHGRQARGQQQVPQQCIEHQTFHLPALIDPGKADARLPSVFSRETSLSVGSPSRIDNASLNRAGGGMTSAFGKGTVPFSLRENWGSPQAVLCPIVNRSSR